MGRRRWQRNFIKVNSLIYQIENNDFQITPSTQMGSLPLNIIQKLITFQNSIRYLLNFLKFEEHNSDIVTAWDIMFEIHKSTFWGYESLLEISKYIMDDRKLFDKNKKKFTDYYEDKILPFFESAQQSKELHHIQLDELKRITNEINSMLVKFQMKSD